MAGQTRLRTLLAKHLDVFRLEFGHVPPIGIEPMKVHLTPGAKPVRCTARRYPPLHRQFLEKHVKALLAAGLVYVNPRSRWASPPRIVAKKAAGQYRMTIDTRGVDACTEPMPWPMPNLEVIMGHLEGTNRYFSFDWFRGYWQLPLHPESQELFTFMTHEGMYTPTRVPMGASDAVAYCQSAVQLMFHELLYHGILAWLDDVLGYASSEDSLLDIMESFFDIASGYGLKLHPKKCQFYCEEAVWCGKLVSANGISHSPERISGLTNLSPPSTAADPQQFICATNWMRQHIPMYASLIAPLAAALETAAGIAHSRQKTKLAKVLLTEVGWERQQQEAFDACRAALVRMVPLAYPRSEAEVCVYTDASDEFWGAIVTQVEPTMLSRPRDDQAHEPLAFLSGRFVGAASRWPIVEKEAFAVVETCKRLEYILLRPGGFRIFTDHRNLIYMFDPLSIDGNLQRYQMNKLQRWAMVMASFPYKIEHVDGVDNVWADMLSRWGAPQPVHAVARMRAIVGPAMSPLEEAAFHRPTRNTMAAVQQDCDNIPINLHAEADGLLVTEEGKVWIPPTAVDLQQRLCVISHAGRSGHRGETVTLKAIARLFIWDGIQEDVKQFVRKCLHCLRTDGTVQPRPFGETVTATRPNEVVHFEFLTMPRASDGSQYVFVVKDGFSGYVELTICPSCTSDQAYDALLGWFSRFGVVSTWVSDRGAHFTSTLVDRLRKSLGIRHHLTMAYCPWSNGSVEVVNRLLLKCVRAIMSKKKLALPEWPSVIPMVQSALNHQASDRLGGVPPITAFTQLPAQTPLTSVLQPPGWVEVDFTQLGEKVPAGSGYIGESDASSTETDQ